MLSFCGGLKIFLAVVPCDLRKSFNGLHGLVTEQLGEDPRSGALFVFTNRRHSRLKILLFDGTGLWVCTKRLEKGTFLSHARLDFSQAGRKYACEALREPKFLTAHWKVMLAACRHQLARGHRKALVLPAAS